MYKISKFVSVEFVFIVTMKTRQLESINNFPITLYPDLTSVKIYDHKDVYLRGKKGGLKNLIEYWALNDYQQVSNG